MEFYSFYKSSKSFRYTKEQMEKFQRELGNLKEKSSSLGNQFVDEFASLDKLYNTYQQLFALLEKEEKLAITEATKEIFNLSGVKS